MAEPATELTLDSAALLAAEEHEVAIVGRSPWYLAWRRLRRNYVALFSLFIFLAIVISGLEHVGAPIWAQPMFNGCVLIVAVAASGWAFRRKAARARKENLQMLLFESEAATREGAGEAGLCPQQTGGTG